MSKNSPLNQAVGNIQSNKPRVLPKLQTFTPPIQVQNPPQDQKVTHPLDEKSTQDQESTMDTSVPEDQNPSSDEMTTPDRNSPLDDKCIPPTKPRLTQEERTVLTLENLRKGYTRIPNGVLIEIIYGGLSKAEIKILLLIARYTLSFDERPTAALSKADIERYTQLQGKSILEALQGLLDKNLIIKIKGDQYTSNQLGLNLEPGSINPLPKRQQEPSEKAKKLPLRKDENPPSVQNGPQDEKVTPTPDKNLTHPGDEKITSPTDQKSTHFKEFSSKNNSLSYNFPDDLTVRWKKFEASGNFSHSKKERDIFQKLFIDHGKQFFDNCGKVISFLETHGNGKAGEDGKIHSPMIWINGHWEMNFSRYQSWLTKEQSLKEAQALKAEKDAQKQAQERELTVAKANEEKESLEWEIKMEAATQRFLSLHQSEREVNAFADNVIRESGCTFTRNAWKTTGWKSPLVKSFVIQEFLKAEKLSTLTQGFSEPVEATA